MNPIALAVALALATCVIGGCHGNRQTNAQTQPVMQVQPKDRSVCEPNVSAEVRGSGVHAARITELVPESREYWSTTHSIECGENESTVLPSLRMYKYASAHFDDGDAHDQWLAEHTYCQPDNFAPTQRPKD